MGSGGRATKTRGMPPDDNTAADPSGATWVVWLVLVGPSLLLVTLVVLGPLVGRGARRDASPQYGRFGLTEFPT